MREPFGHYTLLRRLAVGGMAEIFVAEHAFAAPGDGRVVIKRILPHLSEDPSFVRMFIDEARLAVGLVHPNIVRTLDFGCVHDEHYLTMAYVAGIDLHRLLAGRLQRQKSLGVAATCALGLGLARGLGHTHRFVSADGTAQHVVHRDVSPHNVMVGQNGVPRLMDFGIAKAALRLNHTATGAGTIKGKLGYMAPEQARGEPATQRSDQYSLGVVLWECLAGQRLFARVAQERLHAAARPVEALSLQAVAPEVPALLASIVMRALQHNPQQRFADVDAFCRALETFVAHHTDGERAAQRALAECAQAAEEAHHDPSDWSWQQGPEPGCGTVRLTAATPAHGPNIGRKAKRPLGRRAPQLARMPHARALAGRPRPAHRRSRALTFTRMVLRMRIWWAIYAAACGAAGHALWPQAAARVAATGSAAATSCIVNACMP